MQLTAPAEAKVGDTVEVVWKTVAAASSNPDVLDLEKDTVKPTGTIKVGGAAVVTCRWKDPGRTRRSPRTAPWCCPT